MQQVLSIKGSTLSERLKDIRARIEKALSRSRYGHRAVTIVGASKAQSLNSIREAAELGVIDMGENYAQELLTKAPMALGSDIRWHFIGKLQSNKVKHILPYVASIDSVDSLELAQRIARVRDGLDIKRAIVPIMIQVNIGSERQKSGLPPAVVDKLFQDFCKIEGVGVSGLMCIPPVTKDAERARQSFALMKKLFDELRKRHPQPEIFRALSMGMSGDFEMAIEEGSTCVRIGEALFGPRPSSDE